MMKSIALAAGTALASATLWMTPAFAQDAAAPQAAAQPDYGSDIIVTATRRETTLQSTPIPVSAFCQAQLDSKQVKDATHLATFVPQSEHRRVGQASVIT